MNFLVVSYILPEILLCSNSNRYAGETSAFDQRRSLGISKYPEGIKMDP